MKLKLPKVFLTLTNNGVELLVPTATIVFVGRTFDSHDVGAWMLFGAVCVFASKFRESLVQAAMVREASKEGGYFVSLKAGAILSVVVECLFSLIIYFVGVLDLFHELTPFFICYPFYGFGMAFYRWQATSHQVKHDVGRMFSASLAFLIFSLLSLFVLYLKTDKSISGVVLIQGISYGVGGVVGLVQLPVKDIFLSKANRQLFYSIINFGKYGLFRDFFGTFSARIGIFLTAGWLSFTQTAALGIVQRISQIVSMPSVASQMLFFPLACKLANSNQLKELSDLFEQNVARTIASLLPIALVVLLFSKSILGFIGSYDYITAAPVLAIAVLNIALLVPFGQAFGSITNAIGKPYLNTKIVAVNAVLNILFSVSFIWMFGLLGAVIAPAVTDLIGFFWIRRILIKEIDVEIEKCFFKVPGVYKEWVALSYNTLYASFVVQK